MRRRFIKVYPFLLNKGFELLRIKNISKVFLVQPFNTCEIMIVYYQDKFSKYSNIKEKYENEKECMGRFNQLSCILNGDVYHNNG